MGLLTRQPQNELFPAAPGDSLPVTKGDEAKPPRSPRADAALLLMAMLLGILPPLVLVILVRLDDDFQKADFEAAVWVAAGLSILLFMAGSYIWARPKWRARQERLARAVTASGVVTRIETGRPNGRDEVEFPVVRYTTATGHELEERAAVGKNGVLPGAAVSVLYDPQEEQWMRIAGDDKRENLMLAGFVALMVVVSAALIAYGLVALAG